jgi:hypothetical protein
MSDKVIVFQRNNARILHDPENLQDWRSSPNAMVNPDMSLVKGVSPRYWKKGDHNIVQRMSPQETDERKRYVLSHPTNEPLYCYKTVELQVPVPMEVEIVNEVVLEKEVPVPYPMRVEVTRWKHPIPYYLITAGLFFAAGLLLNKWPIVLSFLNEVLPWKL